MEFGFDSTPSSEGADGAVVLKYYEIYLANYVRFGRAWARKVGQFEKRRQDPFSRVNREVNTAMRRYLGADNFALYGDTLEYLIQRDGILVKDTRNNTLDIPERTFNDWVA